MKLTIHNDNLVQSIELMMKLSEKTRNNVDVDHSSVMEVDLLQNCLAIATPPGLKKGFSEVKRTILYKEEAKSALLKIDLAAMQRFSAQLKKLPYLELEVDLENQQLVLSGATNLSETLMQRGLFEDETMHSEQVVYRMRAQVIERNERMEAVGLRDEYQFSYQIEHKDIMLFERTLKLTRHSTGGNSVVGNISLFPRGIALLIKGKEFQVLARAFAAESHGNVSKEPLRLTVKRDKLGLLNHALSIVARQRNSGIRFSRSQIVVYSDSMEFRIDLGEADRKLTPLRLLKQDGKIVVMANKLIHALKEIDVASQKYPLNLRLTGEPVLEVSLANKSRYAAHRVALKVDDAAAFTHETIQVSRALMFRATELFADEDLLMTFEKEREAITIEFSSKQSKNTVLLDARLSGDS
ncbi:MULTISPECIES: hypothetical protein [Idiomarina]|nr:MULTISPECIES: hypothetical protein [Idiomarina]MAC34255.1 hypothetical protein [Haliea sp.]MAO67413.1 hypothetical protein [Idiomarina sp.]MBF80405.1 hypothetical protein [Idiomarina sp.]MBP59171.1 hypothetical protein [Idiomarina sp.]|tara:strand:- start:14907 stop:16139 length:1233 start_codon:yes stop_codon:yes gene_type:complete